MRGTRRRRPARRAVPSGLAVLLAGALAACTAQAPIVPGAPTVAASPVATAPSGATEPPAAPAPSQPRIVPGPPRLSAAEAPGLVARLAATTAADLTAAVRWATPPGRSALGDTLDARVQQLARDFASQHGAAWVPAADVVPGGSSAPCRGATVSGAAGAVLSVDCSIVTAAGSLLGERLTVLRREAGGAGSVAREVWYGDAATGAVHDGAALYEPGREGRVLGLVAEALRSAGRAEAAADPFAGLDAAAMRALLADSAVTREGIIVTLAVAGSTAPVSVLVPGRLLQPFLSEAGLAATATAAADEPYAAPSAPVGDDPVDCSFATCVSITFDDGPTGLTAGLLDLLDGARAPATFYVQGSSVQRAPGTAARIAESGHELANHTWAHPDLTKLKDDEAVRREVERTQAAIRDATGVTARSIRPPYGASDERVRGLVALPFVVWDVDTVDWRDPGPEVVVERAVGGSRRGSIVLMHDTHEQTVEAVPGVIAGLRARGFTLATVAEQFGGSLPASGLLSHGPR
ncbi:polysaccharide deacetylase family protein [Agromyces arachidis]|uniref:polysaccharide deacetylase family protein n=1 Tax=Agromyces arachidis TaxID=766966 RepID=UPI0040570DC5